MNKQARLKLIASIARNPRNRGYYGGLISPTELDLREEMEMHGKRVSPVETEDENEGDLECLSPMMRKVSHG